MSKATKRERQKENRERAREERERLLKRDRQMKALRGFLILLVPIAIIAIVVSATSSDAAFDKTKGYTATIETSEGNIVIALDAKKAPIATEHFVDLVDKKFYDGLCIDRLAKDFVIQGGSPKCDAKGGSGTSVSGETPQDHYPIRSLAAAKATADPAGTFDSQFFIVTGAQGATLPNEYARFGTVISGLDVAQKIEGLPITPGSANPTDGTPATKILIKQIRIKVTPKPVTAVTSTGPSSSTTTAPAASSTTVAPSTSSTTTKK